MHDLPIIRSVAQLRSRIRSWRAFGESVAVIPTRGDLHEGHLSLIRAARREADRALVSIFVDPLDRPEGFDADAYGENEERDAELADQEGADAIFAPAASTLYPPDFATEIRVRGLTDVLCGEDAPHRFDGFVRSSVKLLNQATAEFAVVGERDWQRVAILRRVARDLDMPTKIVVAPTERDMDGIAWSAGVEALEGADRAAARKLWPTLRRAAEALLSGADVDATLDAAADALADAGAEVEYLEMRDAASLAEMTAPDPAREARVFAAIAAGGLRLIDNVPVAPAQGAS